MKKLFVLCVIMMLSSCSPTIRQSFSELSRPEKTWVTFHPFKAKKAYLISLEAEKVKDSMARDNSIGNDNNGGNLDAFKHSYWMARLTQNIGKRAANRLGKAHEKGNYLTYKKRSLEDGIVPDKPSTDMDLFNNQIGIDLVFRNKKVPKKEVIAALITALKNGKLRVLLKDEKGNFLDCTHKRIPLDSLKNKWDTKKCLIPSTNS